MYAVSVERPGQICYGEVPDPQVGADEVLVAVRNCGICGTDLHIADGDLATARYPVVPGHEFAGEVVEVGSGVEDLKVGDLVAVDPSLFCGRCRPCRMGHENMCERWAAIGVTVAGGSAQYAAVPAWNAHKLPAGFDTALGALIEPLSCAVHGYDMVKTKLGDRFLVYGAGTMGLMMMLLGQRVGAISVVVVEPNEARRQKAKALGATAVVAGPADLEGRFDLVIDATGVVSAIEDALGRVRPGGSFLQFGVAPSHATARFSPFKVYNEEITLVGSMAVLKSYDRACEIATDTDIDLRSLISAQLPLSSYADALEQARRGEGYKLQVLPG